MCVLLNRADKGGVRNWNTCCGNQYASQKHSHLNYIATICNWLCKHHSQRLTANGWKSWSSWFWYWRSISLNLQICLNACSHWFSDWRIVQKSFEFESVQSKTGIFLLSTLIEWLPFFPRSDEMSKYKVMNGQDNNYRASSECPMLHLLACHCSWPNMSPSG